MAILARYVTVSPNSCTKLERPDFSATFPIEKEPPRLLNLGDVLCPNRLDGHSRLLLRGFLSGFLLHAGFYLGFVRLSGCLPFFLLVRS
jgi:hypothetical protein